MYVSGLPRITTITTFGTAAPHGFGISGLGGPEVSGLGSWDKGIAVVFDDSGITVMTVIIFIMATVTGEMKGRAEWPYIQIFNRDP